MALCESCKCGFLLGMCNGRNQAVGESSTIVGLCWVCVVIGHSRG